MCCKLSNTNERTNIKRSCASIIHYTHTEISPECCKSEHNLDCNYTFRYNASKRNYYGYPLLNLLIIRLKYCNAFTSINIIIKFEFTLGPMSNLLLLQTLNHLVANTVIGLFDLNTIWNIYLSTDKHQTYYICTLQVILMCGPNKSKLL